MSRDASNSHKPRGYNQMRFCSSTLSIETHKAKFPGVEMHCRNSLNCLIDQEFEFARVHLKIFAIMYLLKDNTTH